MMEEQGLQVKPVTTLPRVDFGPVSIEWVFKDGFIIYHVYRSGIQEWSSEGVMRAVLGQAFGDIGVDTDTVQGAYTEEVDSWAVRAPLMGSDSGLLVKMTATFGEHLAERLGDA